MTSPLGVKSRIEWVDTGRGIAIVLVALFHSTNWIIGVGVNVEYWRTINEVLSSLRMPLFFTLSGLFAAKWLQAGWGQLWAVKVRLFLWVFLLWEVIGSAAFTLGMTMTGQRVGLRDILIGLVVSPVMPRFELWFIWALALLFLFAKAIRRIDYRIQLGVTGIVSMAALSGWEGPNVGWEGLAKYAFFFLSGLYLRRWIMGYGELRKPWLLGMALVAWAVISVGLSLLGLRDIFGLYFVNCLLGVVGGIALSRALLRLGALTMLGGRTLPVYLAHTPFVIIISFLISQLGLVSSANAIAPIAPVLVAGIAVTLALGLNRVARRAPLLYLFEPPAGLLVPGTHRARTGRRLRRHREPRTPHWPRRVPGPRRLPNPQEIPGPQDVEPG